jgi:hypothetical protein
MHIDSFFTMGKSHKVCEDYALCNTSLNLFGISDGCSSSKDTDFGSRILLKSVEASLPKIKADKLHSKDHIWLASQIMLNSFQNTIDIHALDATLIYGYDNESHINVEMMGDGVIAIQYKDGAVEIHEKEYEQNAPYYITYMFDAPRDAEYKKLNQMVDYHIKKCDSKWETLGSSSYGTQNDIEFLTLDKSICKSISVFSDGIKTLLPNNPSGDKPSLIQILAWQLVLSKDNYESIH